MDIRVGRVYDPTAAADGVRVLVDRLWPRGVSQARADLDLWAKDATPSTELRRRWHEPGATVTETGQQELADALRQELSSGTARAGFEQLVEFVRHKPVVTLLTGSRSPEHSHVPVIRALLEEALSAQERSED